MLLEIDLPKDATGNRDPGVLRTKGAFSFLRDTPIIRRTGRILMRIEGLIFESPIEVTT